MRVFVWASHIELFGAASRGGARSFAAVGTGVSAWLVIGYWIWQNVQGNGTDGTALFNQKWDSGNTKIWLEGLRFQYLSHSACSSKIPTPDVPSSTLLPYPRSESTGRSVKVVPP